MAGLSAAVTVCSKEKPPVKLRIEFFGGQRQGWAGDRATPIIATHGMVSETVEGAEAMADQARSALETLGIPLREHAPSVADL